MTSTARVQSTSDHGDSSNPSRLIPHLYRLSRAHKICSAVCATNEKILTSMARRAVTRDSLKQRRGFFAVFISTAHPRHRSPTIHLEGYGILAQRKRSPCARNVCSRLYAAVKSNKIECTKKKIIVLVIHKQCFVYRLRKREGKGMEKK